MGKRRNKKSTKQNPVANSLPPVNIALPENICAEEMQRIIANAIVEAEEIKKCKEKEQHDIAQAEWHKKIGYKKYNSRIKDFFNGINAFFKMFFLREKDIEGDRFSVALIQSIIVFILWIVGCFFLAIAVVSISRCFIGDTTQFSWWEYVLLVLLALFSVMLFRLLQMVSIEVDKTESSSYLLNLFAAITSFIAMIVAVIAVVKGA